MARRRAGDPGAERRQALDNLDAGVPRSDVRGVGWTLVARLRQSRAPAVPDVSAVPETLINSPLCYASSQPRPTPDSPFPILQPQPRDTGKLAGVVRHQHGVVDARGGGDEDVVRADGPALARQLGADLRRFLGAAIVEG